jgi:uncharacterized protein (TIGR02145 family)
MIKYRTLVVFLMFFMQKNFSQVGIGTSVPDASAILELKSTTKGFLLPRLTKQQRDLIVNPTEGLQIFNTTSNCIEIFVANSWLNLCTRTKDGSYLITSLQANTVGFFELNEPATINNYVDIEVDAVQLGSWSGSSNNVNGVVFTGFGEFTSTGVQFIRLYATGTPSSTNSSLYTITFNIGTTKSFNYDTICQSAIASFDTEIVEVVSPTTGRIWMDRNLGAKQAAVNINDCRSFGSFFQWVRNDDGHEQARWISNTLAHFSTGTNFTATGTISSNAATTTAPNNVIFFIPTTTVDWLATSQGTGNLWWNTSTNASGSNNPCPSGYHVPTQAEWSAELGSNINNATAAFNSFLKIPISNTFRSGVTGGIVNTSETQFWTSTHCCGGRAPRVSITSSSSSVTGNQDKKVGLHIRCIKN